MNEEELSKSIKPFPGSDPVVYARKDFESIFLGKDIVVLYPAGKKADAPTVWPSKEENKVTPSPVAPAPAIDVEKLMNEMFAELYKKFDEQLKAKDAEIVALKAPAAPKADATKVENKMVGSKKTLKEDAAKVFVAEMLRRGR